jgi:hypothetical protein
MGRTAPVAWLFALLLGCGPTAAPPPPAGDVRWRPATVDAAAGQLQVFLTEQTTDGRFVKLRGLVRNPYPEQVTGVRLVARILRTPGVDANPFDTLQRSWDVTIPAGQRVPLRWDLETMYGGAAVIPGGLVVEAFAAGGGAMQH